MNNIKLLKKDMIETLKDYVAHAEQAPDDEILDRLYRVMKATFAYPLLCSYCAYCVTKESCIPADSCLAGVKEWLKR